MILNSEAQSLGRKLGNGLHSVAFFRESQKNNQQCTLFRFREAIPCVFFPDVLGVLRRTEIIVF